MVSVIIPCWGSYKQYLPECLAELHKQTYKDYEVIVVDWATDLPTARNEGIKKAKGDRILCLDVDDKIDPTFLEKTTAVNDDIVGVWYKEYGDYEINIEVANLRPTLDDMKKMNHITCATLFKKEIWDTVEGFDETMKDGFEDWDFWLQALKAGYTITIIPEILFFYHKHGETMIEKARERGRELHKYILSKL